MTVQAVRYEYEYEYEGIKASANLIGQQWQIEIEIPGRLRFTCPKDRDPAEIIAAAFERLGPLKAAMAEADLPYQAAAAAYQAELQAIRDGGLTQAD